MKTIIYSRVSTSKQADNGHSLENQKERLNKFCELHKLTEIVELVDEASGRETTKRPAFNEMIDLIKKGKVSNVVVYSLSRLGRNTKEVLTTVELFNKHNVVFASLTEKIDTSSASGKFFLTVISALAEMESAQLSERITSVLQNRKENGFAIGRTPFGFDKGEDGKLVKNKEEQKTLSIIADLDTKAFSLNRIATELVKQKRKNKLGKPSWSNCSIHRYVKQIRGGEPVTE